MKELKNLAEGFYIRFLWVLHATRLRPTPGLCPPACTEGHTYKWPCRQRISKDTYLRRQHAYYDPSPDMFTGIKTEPQELFRDPSAPPTPWAQTKQNLEDSGMPNEDNLEQALLAAAMNEKFNQCLNHRAGGYGQIASQCSFEKGHKGPHSWVVT